MSVPVTHFLQVDLADRWRISHRTLERWRWTGDGPAFLKIGGRVVYRLEDVEAYEVSRRCSRTSDKVSREAGVRFVEKLKEEKNVR